MDKLIKNAKKIHLNKKDVGYIISCIIAREKIPLNLAIKKLNYIILKRIMEVKNEHIFKK